MGFKIEYLSDGTAKGVLDLKEEVFEARCRELANQREDSEAEKQKTSVSKESKQDTKAASA